MGAYLPSSCSSPWVFIESNWRDAFHGQAQGDTPVSLSSTACLRLERPLSLGVCDKQEVEEAPEILGAITEGTGRWSGISQW